MEAAPDESRLPLPTRTAGLIPEPVTARRGLPDWLKGMPSQVHSEELGLDIETVKQCPPFVDAMSGGSP